MRKLMLLAVVLAMVALPLIPVLAQVEPGDVKAGNGTEQYEPETKAPPPPPPPPLPPTEELTPPNNGDNVNDQDRINDPDRINDQDTFNQDQELEQDAVSGDYNPSVSNDITGDGNAVATNQYGNTGNTLVGDPDQDLYSDQNNDIPSSNDISSSFR